jgi:hypothetical protein
MLFKTFETKLIHIAAKTFQTVYGAVATLDMSFKLQDRIRLNMLGLRTFVADLHLVDNILEQLGLNVSESIHFFGLAMHTDWLSASLCFLVLR